jgi:ABC-type multidrug transport system fused ATPase/permease subunit
VFALEALELLGCRTPTTSLEAIALRHKLEVKAECMFQGMEYNIEVKSRFREINGEVRAVSHWFNPATRKRSALNAEMSVVTEIMRIFREYGQFDEEQECLKHFRELNRRWYFLNHPWFRPIHPLRWYVETLIGSFRLFVLAILGWPVVFGLLSFATGATFGANGGDIVGLGHHLTNAYFSFFGLQPSVQPNNSAAHILTLLLVVIGFAHLGIFISHLYSLVSRK